MNEAVASSFPAALRACMEAGCGKKLNADGFAAPWTQRMLAEEVEVSDRAVRQWLGGERTPDSKNFEQLLFILSPKDCPRQRAVYEQLEANRPPPMITRQPRRRSAAAEPQPIPPDARPYRGLESFREEDAHLFFGRDTLVQNVLDKLAHHRLVLLIGASGSGKSSLINAGILPKLRQDPARTIVRCTPVDRAIANLAAALARAIEPDRSPAELLASQRHYRQQLEADPEAIRDIAQLLPEGRLFLVIDQFEESFTLTRPANPKQHDALIATLLAIARSPDERRLNALLGMRSDFQNELETADPELIQRLDNAMVQMRPMLPAEREAAITEPARAYGVALQPGLLTAITDDLTDNRDALPLLEVALDELWSRRDDSRRRLTLAAFAEIGGITGALGQRADSNFQHLGLDETLVRRLFLELVRVDPEGASTKSTRRPRTRQELGEELWQLGERLTAPGLRLLVTYRDEGTGEQLLDVTHEAIFRQWRRLAGWIDEERDFIMFCQRLDQRLAEFTASGENPDYLLPRTDVQEAQRWQIERGKTFHPDHQYYLARSATSWAEDAADNAARALWARLELSFDRRSRMPEHDWIALTSLWPAKIDTVRRFLVQAMIDQDSARKFNRRPTLVLRSALGFNPATAIARAASALKGPSAAALLETGLAWLALARYLSPITAINTPDTVDCTIALAGQTTDPYQLNALAWTIIALADKLDHEAMRETATRIVERAIDLAGKTTDTSQFDNLAWTIVALADKLDRDAATLTVDRAINLYIDISGKTTFSPAPQALVKAIAALAGKLDRDAAIRTVDRAIDVVEKTNDSEQLHVMVQVIAAFADKLGCEVATRTVDRAIDLTGNTTFAPALQALAQVIADLADRLDREAVTRTVDRAIDLAGNTNDADQIQAIARTIVALVDKLDPKAATRAVDRAVDLAGNTTDPDQLQAMAQAIAALAGKLDPVAIREAATRIVNRAIDLAGNTTDPDQLQALAHAIAALAGKLDPDVVREAATRTVDRAIDLASKTTSSPALQALAQTIVALADRLDREVATRTVDRAIDLAGNTTSSPALQAMAQAIAAIAGKLDCNAATRTVDRAIDLAGKTTDPDQLQAMAQAIAALAGKLDPVAIREAATRIVDRAIGLTGKATELAHLEGMAKEIAALAVLAAKLDPDAIPAAASRTVGRVIDLAARTNDPDQLDELQAIARGIAALAPLLPGAVVVLAAIELLKHPLGGDEAVTETLLRAIITALDCPDLLRPFPEQSFWAVMQHLAKLKAANPDWDWLDLARPPLPPDELVATFRRLCADPPAWQTA